MGSAGTFITVDGPSGVGKTTLAGLLETHLAQRGRAVRRTSQPSPSAIGQLARFGTDTFHGRALSCLIAADRYHHVETEIQPALERGEVVICDRYLPSSLVLDQLDGVPTDFVWALHRDLPWPDIALFLTGDWQLCAQRAAERGSHSRFHQADAPVKKQEQLLFDQVAADLAGRGYPVHRHDIGHRDAEAVREAVTGHLAAQLGL